MVHLPEIYCDSLSEGKILAISKVGILIKNLEEIYEGLKVEDYKIGKIFESHVAWLNNPIAEQYAHLGRAVEMKEIHIDASKETPELETVGRKAFENMEIIEEYEKQ